MSERQFYIYALWVEGAEYPFYIGKGVGDRCFDHLYPCSYNNPRGNRHKNNTIKKALREGKKIEVYLIEWDLTETEALESECAWIAYYGRRDLGTGCLTNLTAGGEGVSGYVFSQEAIKRLADKRRGKKQSAESIQRRAAANTGKKRSALTCYRISVANRGRVCSKEHAKKLGEARRLADSVVEARINLNNPLFEVVRAHSTPGHSTVKCRRCGGEITCQNGNLFRGVLPSEHQQCADEVFCIKDGSQVYSVVGGGGYRRIDLNTPTGMFDYRVAPAGIIYFDTEGNELYRERLPRAYTQARIAGERRLRQ